MSGNTRSKINSAKDEEINLDEFRKSQLELHNEFRRKHHASPLILDDELNKLSLQWAQKLAADNKLMHNPNTKHGENVFYTSKNPEDATESWYMEIEQIDPTKPIEKEFMAKQIGHFTAVVWKNTQRLGISFVKSSSDAYFVVANYDPPANILNKIAENVQL